MRGVIIAGGNGTRLFPVTKVMSKHLFPVYDKPMIYYPLSTLMDLGIRKVAIVSSASHSSSINRLLGTGSSWGMSISYEIQNEPLGIPDAIKATEQFAEKGPIVVILGDNIFLDLPEPIPRLVEGANIVLKTVVDPTQYGIATLDEHGMVTSVEEKPSTPKSNLAITGLYSFDCSVFDRIKDLKPSKRGELEVVDLIRHYMDNGELTSTPLSENVYWKDAGTATGLLEASQAIAYTQSIRGILLGSPDRVALEKRYVTFRHICKDVPDWASLPYYKQLNKHKTE